MKVLLYTRDYETVKESGVGKAIDHQIKALKLVGCDFTLDEREDYDLVHINTVFPKSAAFANKAHRQGKKVVYHGHSTKEDFKNSFALSNQLAPAFKAWLIHCYNKGDLILTPTDYSKEILKSYNLKRPIEVVSNGIDLDFWQSKPKDRDRFYEKYNLDKSKKSVVSVGLPIKRKGIDDFIKLARALPDYEFVWFGKLNPKILPSDIKKAMANKTTNLHFPGYITSEEVREAYSGSDLYVFLTREETEGIVLLEALATKADILIRDIEIFEKDFTDGTNIYKGKDYNGFKEKIVDILEKRLPSLSDIGYKEAYKKSIENTGKRLVECYKKVLDI